MQITVFTPTYNRGRLLNRLYQSLKTQNCNNFEWIIADDGSSDDTQGIVEKFINENAFPIIYFKQENRGKHIAINNAVKIAKGELFVIVDSDDYLAENALNIIVDHWEILRDNEHFAGIVPNKCYFNGVSIGNPKYNSVDCNPLEFRYKLKENGDKFEIIRTSLFRKYPFPETDEKFCPEALFFNRLHDYKLRYINQNLYYCEYLPDGLTAKIFQIRRNSPINTCLCYTELAKYKIPILHKLKAGINFYRFKRYTNADIESPLSNPILNYISYCFSNLIYLLFDKKK